MFEVGWGCEIPRKTDISQKTKAGVQGNFYPGVDKFEIHFEGRINTPEEQLNKENKEKGQLKNRNRF